MLLTSGEQEARVSRCSVIDAPDELPDGYYEARFSDQSAFLRRFNRAWGTGIAWVVTTSGRQSEPNAEPSVPEWTRRRAG